MTQSVMNVVPENGESANAVSAQDNKSWNLVQRVTEHMRENAMYNYARAFRDLGVCKGSFYNAIRRPFVQDQLIKRYKEQNTAELELINTSWYPIVRYQMELARGDHGARDAAGAARWVKDRLETLESRIEAPEEQEEGSEAAVLLQTFMEDAEKRVKLTRTVTKETIET